MAQSEKKTCCTSGPQPIFFSFHATSWHREKFLDTPLYRSSTDFFFFLRHPLAQSRSPRHTAHLVLDRFFFFLRHLVAQSRSPRRTAQTVHATMWPDKQNQTVRLKRTLTETSRPTPLKGQARKGANSINNFFGPQPKQKQLPNI